MLHAEFWSASIKKNPWGFVAIVRLSIGARARSFDGRHRPETICDAGGR